MAAESIIFARYHRLGSWKSPFLGGMLRLGAWKSVFFNGILSMAVESIYFYVASWGLAPESRQVALRKPLEVRFKHFWSLVAKWLSGSFWRFILSISESWLPNDSQQPSGGSFWTFPESSCQIVFRKRLEPHFEHVCSLVFGVLAFTLLILGSVGLLILLLFTVLVLTFAGSGQCRHANCVAIYGTCTHFCWFWAM